MHMDATPQGGPPARGEPADRTKTMLFALVAVLAVAVAALALVLVLRGEGDDGATPSPQPTPSATSTTSTSAAPPSATTTVGAPTLTAEEARRVVWPKPGGETTYDAPADAAEELATGLVGFTDPVVGEFRQGDNRSGEVDVRPTNDGPVTTVLVRQMSDGHWYAIGAYSHDLGLQKPKAGAAISSPLAVSGLSRAFEGTILVSVHAQAVPESLGRRPLVGGGSELGPFSGMLTFDAPDDVAAGAIMLTTESAKDGRIWQATVIPVQLAKD
jgi:hypothetical protein